MTAVSADAAIPKWLTGRARPWRELRSLSIGLALADVAPATGFAGGLAMTVALAGQGMGAVWPWLTLAAISLMLRGVIGQAAVETGGRLARAVKSDTRRSILADLFARGARAPDRMTAAVEGVSALDGYYARFLALRVAAGVTPLLVITAAGLASPVAAGILLFTLIPFVVGMILAGSAAADESRRQFGALARLSALFADRIRALPVVLAFEAETRVCTDVARASDELEQRSSRVMRMAFLSSGVLEFFSAISVALIALYCGFNLLRLLPFPVPETLDLGRAFFVLALAPEVYQPMRRLAAAYHDRQAAEAAAPALITPDPAVTTPATLAAAAPAIRFDHVRIAYPGGGVPAVEDFSLEVRPGQIVALVGPSGSGKSSLLHLLLGLAPLSMGEVRVGDASLAACGGFASQIAWASQAPVVVPGSLADNIRIADPSACPGRVQAAAGQVGLEAFLDRPIDERGGGLSGGERRRLGLARALLKRSPLLLLDEPTANLDPASEQAIIAIIRRAARDRTTLVATHSAAVAAMADRVVRL
ncbi:thiol reductant ABC exporter subunit CydD [Rhizobium sp. CRIBSB]|nr:thiol reductant ABC exporter subunit CydD [Rhizobium sp. CRIBSB]